MTAGFYFRPGPEAIHQANGFKDFCFGKIGSGGRVAGN
jgi:hypothetical protein